MHAKLISRLRLIFCVLSVCFPQIFVGCAFVFSSSLIAQLQQPTSLIKVNDDEASWIASITVLVCPIGLLIIGVLTDKIGRKTSIQVAYIPMILSWLILAFANSYVTILIGRIILGIPFGCSACEFLYIAEVSPVKQRPLYLSLVVVFTGMGMTFGSILAVFVAWRTLAGVLIAMSIVGLLLLFMVPESPMWLRSRGRDQEAQRVEKWFGEEAVCPPAMDSVPEDCNRGSGDDIDYRDRDDRSLWSIYTDRSVWLPTLVTAVFFACQQLTGAYVLLFYSVIVLRDFRVQWSVETVTVFLCVARVVGGLAFAGMHRVPRKTLTVISGTLMAASLLVAVVYLKIFKNVQNPPFDFVLIAAFVVYMFAALLGILPMPWILSGEVFPMAVKGTMNGVVQTFGYVIMFVVLKFYPSMVTNFGIEIVWSIFTAFCILSVLFGAFILPETNGKSLNEILSYFESRKKVIKNNIS